MTIREINVFDLKNGFLKALESLAPTEKDQKKALEILRRRCNSQMVKTYVAVNDVDQLVIGTASLLIEPKYLHDGGNAGHIEDVAVHGDFQGCGIGRELMEHVVNEARKAGCYKVVLNCDPKNVPFYEKCGFYKTPDVFMRLDLKEKP